MRLSSLALLSLLLVSSLGLSGLANAQTEGAVLSIPPPAPGSYSVRPSNLVPELPEYPRDPVPRKYPGSWVSSGDYPVRALRQGAEGRTIYALMIDKYGQITDCVITGSSGSAELDEATCRLLLRRASFHPARDDRNRPIVGVYANSIIWLLS